MQDLRPEKFFSAKTLDQVPGGRAASVAMPQERVLELPFESVSPKDRRESLSQARVRQGRGSRLVLELEMDDEVGLFVREIAA